ncbi:MAG: helix-turn-helix domain-containing protein [Canibacter sp.]
MQLQHLQIAAPVMRHLTPSLAWIAQRSSEAKIFPARVPSRREVLTAIALLRADLGRVWRIDELARKVALSTSQLVRLFKTQVSLSPATFLRILRVDRMAELLATTRLGAAEIATAVGWNDPSVASRAFKQRYGETPSVYAHFYRSKEGTSTPNN